MEYKVVVNKEGTFWYKANSDVLHREDGPAIEYVGGQKLWYIFGEEVSEQDVKDYIINKTRPTSPVSNNDVVTLDYLFNLLGDNCKKIKIDGQEYKLVKI